MAVYMLTDCSFLLNHLINSGAFLFGSHEDAFAFTLNHLELNVASLFPITGNDYARVLMAGCLAASLLKRIQKKDISNMELSWANLASEWTLHSMQVGVLVLRARAMNF